jgi:hypothetical protein
MFFINHSTAILARLSHSHKKKRIAEGVGSKLCWLRRVDSSSGKKNNNKRKEGK